LRNRQNGIDVAYISYFVCFLKSSYITNLLFGFATPRNFPLKEVLYRGLVFLLFYKYSLSSLTITHHSMVTKDDKKE